MLFTLLPFSAQAGLAEPYNGSTASTARRLRGSSSLRLGASVPEETPPPMPLLQTARSLRQRFLPQLNKDYLISTAQIPQKATLNKHIDSSHAGWLGAEYGVLYGGWASLLLALYSHKHIKSALLVQLVDVLANLLDKASPRFSFAKKTEVWLANRPLNTVVMAAESLKLIAGIGFAVGLLQANAFKERLNAIRDAQDRGEKRVYDWPARGLYVGSLHVGLHTNHEDKPTPEEGINLVRSEQLNPDSAFWFGVKEAILLKVVLLGSTLGVAYGLTRLFRSGQGEDSFIKKVQAAILHPTLGVKLAITPFLGGLVSLHLVGWLNDRFRASMEAELKKEAATDSTGDTH